MRGRPLMIGTLHLNVHIFATPTDGELVYFINGICHGLRAHPRLSLADLNVWAFLPRAVDNRRDIGCRSKAVITKKASSGWSQSMVSCNMKSG
jgi:hypothetical protein